MVLTLETLDVRLMRVRENLKMAQTPKKSAKNDGSVTVTITRAKRTPLTDAEKTPAARFDRVCGVRVAKVLLLLKGVRTCANPVSYEWTDAQVNAMLRALENSVQRTREKFANAQTAQKNGKKSAPKKIASFFREAGVK